MWSITFHEQNWDNALVLIASTFLSIFGTLVNNRFSAPRLHNLTKLFNESLSRANLACVIFYANLALLIPTQPVIKRMLFAFAVASAVIWVISLFTTEHAIFIKISKMHKCQLAKDNPNFCKTIPTYRQVWGVSYWNMILFMITLSIAFLVAFSNWTCGLPCLQ